MRAIALGCGPNNRMPKAPKPATSADLSSATVERGLPGQLECIGFTLGDCAGSCAGSDDPN